MTRVRVPLMSDAEISPESPSALMNALMLPVGSIRGVGKATAEALAEESGIRTLFDLLLFKPCGVASFRRNPDGGEAAHGDKVTLTVVPRSVSTFGPGGRFVKLHCAAEGLGETDLTFFRLPRNVIERMFPLGMESVAEGKLERFGSRWQIAHPVKLRALPVKNLAEVGGETLRPFYHGGATVAGKQIARLIAKALEHPPRVPEWLDPLFLADMRWPDWLSAVRALHCLDASVTPARRAKALERLAYDELLAYALALAKARQFRQARPARPLLPGILQARAENALPFRLTDGQRQAVRDISEDLSRPVAMMRLLQGDVGSGKTAAALLSMCCAPEHGKQAALMAPTETLAGQLFAAASSLAEKIGLRCAYLSGSLKAKARREALGAIASGEASWIVGTHALFQEDVRFHDLGMVVIDEQHRFGVRQRMRLAEKGDNPHMLLMSATPIPRSLTLCLFGDVACSNITEKPDGRKPIDTRAISAAKLAETEARAAAAAAAGKKVYWICPLVSESEELPVPSAEERFASLGGKLGSLAVLAHGKMPVDCRDEALRQFKSGEARLLVATTVVEVGVDVPDATVMIIESAERFGLSQLHQLRGRVGRGSEASVCLLLHGELTRAGRERLQALRDSDDGFFLAEEDLRLRGAGDVMGVQQSGMTPFRTADLAEHRALAERSHEESRALLDRSGSSRLALTEILSELYGYEERKALIGVG